MYSVSVGENKRDSDNIKMHGTTTKKSQILALWQQEIYCTNSRFCGLHQANKICTLNEDWMRSAVMIVIKA